MATRCVGLVHEATCCPLTYFTLPQWILLAAFDSNYFTEISILLAFLDIFDSKGANFCRFTLSAVVTFVTAKGANSFTSILLLTRVYMYTHKPSEHCTRFVGYASLISTVSQMCQTWVMHD